MDKSIHEARWLLAPVLGVCITFVGIGLLVG